MNDRELLELAAKAAAIPIDSYIYSPDDGGYVFTLKGRNEIWSSLVSDGDTMRLAVDLKLNIYHDGNLVDVQGNFNGEHVYATEEHGTDPRAATRRAVTRAAAEIRKAMIADDAKQLDSVQTQL